VDFLQIRERIQALCTLGGWANVQPTPDYAFLGNEGLRIFNRHSQHNIEDITIATVVGQAAYSLVSSDSRGWITLFDDAIYNSTDWLPQATRDQLRVSNRLWRDAENGTPQYWYWDSPTEIGLFPEPDTVSINVSFQGARHEAVMDADTDTPTLNEDFHEGVCLFGAWFHGKLYSRGEEREIALAYREEALDYVNECKNIVNSQEQNLITRRVIRPVREYMGSGTSRITVTMP
jgi:hypothetical protein